MTLYQESSVIEKIWAIKQSLGEELIILTHHYQRKEIVDLGDYRGDSFGLSKEAAANKKARFIVFCGVHFMAESAAILAQPHQVVQIPDIEAGCWMVDMADNYIVERAWQELTSIVSPESIMPIVYMNSDAYLKAFCGRNGGAVCTSSNSSAVFSWGLGLREKIFFFPDQHLGWNTAHQIGIPKEEVIVWDPDQPLGGNSEEMIRQARLILWDGYCLVHTRFRPEHIIAKRKEHPNARIIVHPECEQEVVALADAAGSTSKIVKYVEEAPTNSTIVIGTEINLIHRLSWEYPDKNILELHYSLCPNMFKINLGNLLWTLENLGDFNVVKVDENVKKDVSLALNRMLDLSSSP